MQYILPAEGGGRGVVGTHIHHFQLSSSPHTRTGSRHKPGGGRKRKKALYTGAPTQKRGGFAQFSKGLLRLKVLLLGIRGKEDYYYVGEGGMSSGLEGASEYSRSPDHPSAGCWLAATSGTNGLYVPTST